MKHEQGTKQSTLNIETQGHLRERGNERQVVPRVHTKQGESAFSYYAARSWNQLPEEIRCAKTLATFKSKLICLVLLLLNEHCAYIRTDFTM